MNIGKLITGAFGWLFCSISLAFLIAIWYGHQIGTYEVIIALAIGSGIFIGKTIEAYDE